MGPPKVLLVSAEYPPRGGGVGGYTQRLAETLASQGAQVGVVTSEAGGEEPQHPFPVWRIMSGWGFGIWGRLGRLLDEVQPSILHIQYQAGAYRHHPAINLTPYRIRLLGPDVAVAVTFHDLRTPYLFPLAGPAREWCLRLMARGADLAIVADRSDLARLARWGAWAERIPIGSNVDPEPPRGFDRGIWRQRAGLEPDELLLAYFGFLHETKGAHVLVGTLARLVAQRYPVRLVMVGRMAGESNPTTIAYAAGVRKALAEAGVADRVIWTGYLEAREVSAWLMAADLCVLPYAEGASLRRGSLMAALAHGLPVVTTFPSGATPELEDGVAVALVPPGDAAVFADRIAALVGSPEELERLGRGAREVSQGFTWERVASAHMEQYKAVLRARGGEGA